jgi:hypothetical protein
MDETEMGTEALIGIPIGIGLSAACGFRVFVPLLVMNLASLAGHLHLKSESTEKRRYALLITLRPCFPSGAG